MHLIAPSALETVLHDKANNQHPDDYLRLDQGSCTTDAKLLFTLTRCEPLFARSTAKGTNSPTNVMVYLVNSSRLLFQGAAVQGKYLAFKIRRHIHAAHALV